MTTTCI